MTTTTISDASLVQAVLAGEKNRFDELVARHLPSVYAVLLARTGNHADAEDLAQETFLNAYRALPRLRDVERFEGWLITIARNASRKLWRRKHREFEVLDAYQATQVESVMPGIESRDEAELLRKHLGQLREKHREVLLLHYFAGKSTIEMSRLLSCSQFAVKKRLQRAREALGREIIESMQQMPLQSRHALEKQATAIATAIAGASLSTGARASGLLSLSMLKTPAGIAAVALGCIAAGSIALLTRNGGQSPDPAEVPAIAVTQGAERDELSRTGAQPVVVAEASEKASEPAAATPHSPREKPKSDQDAPDGDLESVAATPVAQPTDSTQESVDDEDSPLRRQLQNSVNIEFEDIHLREILSFFSDAWNLNIILDPDSIPPPAKQGEPLPDVPAPKYVTDGMVGQLNANNVPLSQALDMLFKPLGLAYVIEPGYLWVSSADALRRTWRPKPESEYEGYDIEAVLAAPANLEFQDIHIADVLAFVTASWEVNIVLDYRVIMSKNAADPLASSTRRFSFDRVHAQGGNGEPTKIVGVNLEPGDASPDGQGAEPGPPAEGESLFDAPGRRIEELEAYAMPPQPGSVAQGQVPRIALQEIQLKHAMEAIIRPFDLAYSVEDGFVWIQRADRARPVQFVAEFPELPEDKRGLLEKPISLEFEEATLDEILKIMSEQSGLQVTPAPSLTPDRRIVERYRVNELPVGTAIRILAAMLDLKFIANNDGILLHASLQ